MAATSRGSNSVASLIRSSRHSHICSSCVSSVSHCQREYGTATAGAKALPSFPTVSQSPPSATTSETSPYVIKSGILLSRPPLLMRPLTSFEKAFFLYQKRLNERLTIPFTRYFYFKKDTPADNDWKRKAKERNGSPAKELGGYQPYGKLAWNDEVLVGDRISEPQTIVETLVRDAVMTVDEYGGSKGTQETKEDIEARVERPLGIFTEADKKKDYKRLDRKLGRTLYLCVRKGCSWAFPSGPLTGRENLHQAAERILVQTAGPNMNTWIVGHVPIGHYHSRPLFKSNRPLKREGEMIFFMKGRIMAGQADLKGNPFSLEDFKWLTKEEVEKHVSPNYYSLVKNMMSER